jgi:hypothetical protein
MVLLMLHEVSDTIGDRMESGSQHSSSFRQMISTIFAAVLRVGVEAVARTCGSD